MDAVHSGTGVFYQAMPAIGADGKNIMKLIPVQMVNGQFVQSQINNPIRLAAPQKAAAINIVSAPVATKAALNPSATQQIIRKQVSIVNGLPYQVGSGDSKPLNNYPLQQQAVSLLARVPPMATLSANCEKSARLPIQLPVTVKSPALPSGQYLQIPPNAQVRTILASELPPGIKEQILTSSASPAPGSSLSNVVCVSPVTTMDKGVTPSNDSTLDSLKLLSKTSCGRPPTGAKPHLKLTPKVSQRPNSPTRWVIEEVDGSAETRRLKPLNSQSVTSEILQAVSERETAGKQHDTVKKSGSQTSQGSSLKGEENALVMCNGKVFLVAKKCSLPFKNTAATERSEFNKHIVPSSSQQSFESPQTRRDLRTPGQSDEVIDLCDDDAQDDSPQQAATVSMPAVSHLDEDNVIFVSYIPPKSDLMKETEQLTSDSRAEVSALRGGEPGRSVTVRDDTRACGSAVMDTNDNEDSNIKSQQSTSTRQLNSVEVDEDAGSNRGEGSQIERNTQKMESSTTPAPMWTSPLEPKPCPATDHLLREIFGITADVKICLHRIDEAVPGSVPAEPLHTESIRPVDDDEEPMSSLKEDCYSPQEPDVHSRLISVRRIKALPEQELSAALHTGVTPLKCSHFKLNTNPPQSALKQKCHSGQCSRNRTSCDTETEPVIDYVEPIDEDFLGTDENNTPTSQVAAQTQTIVDLNTRRMGRMRKRTMCPCCIPATLYPAAKSSERLEKPEKWAVTTEQVSKRGRQTKAPRQEGRTSGRISGLTAKSKQNCEAHQASASLSTTSMDSDELKRHEEIKRLKDLLKEKEAALELMRNSMS